MKAKQFFLSILFLFLGLILLTSCEKENITEELEINRQIEIYNFRQIDRADVEDPGDRGN